MVTMKKERIELAILLATYNGERYLQEQIDSLYSQTYKNWSLFIHDDGSTDSTLEIINKNASKHDNIIVLNYPSHKGAKENFFSMLQTVDAAYYMFCDQDDVWVENKIAVSIKRMHELEKQFNNSEIPIIVHSDLYVVNSNMELVDKSFWHYSGIRPDYINNFERLMPCNLVTGCTMLINQKAKYVSFSYSRKYAHMHDAWITACVMKVGGIVSEIKTPLVYYRQHLGNFIGANKQHPFRVVYIIKNLNDIYKKNKKQYLMFKSIGGTLFKYMYNKILYRIRTK